MNNQVVHSVVSGLVVGLFSILFYLSYAALIFAGPLAPWLAYLQLVATQAITVNNASRPVGSAPSQPGASTGGQTGGGTTLGGGGITIGGGGGAPGLVDD